MKCLWSLQWVSSFPSREQAQCRVVLIVGLGGQPLAEVRFSREMEWVSLIILTRNQLRVLETI